MFGGISLRGAGPAAFSCLFGDPHPSKMGLQTVAKNADT